MKKFEQISVKVIGRNTAKVYLNLHHFNYPKLLGTLYRQEKTFRTIKRNFSNLFHLFGKSGLGINSEVLSRLNFEIIEIPYNDQILMTTIDHFLKNSIPSPFQSDKVDHQRILSVNDFIIPVEQPTEKQTNMFEEVA